MAEEIIKEELKKEELKKEELIEKLRSARARLMLIISECDDLELRTATVLRVEYTEKIGQYECRQYELYLHFEELKHKIEMVQAKINRGEEVDIIAIDDEVADILAAYYEKLNGMRISVIEMEGYTSGGLVDAVDRAEIKRIYRKLMKILHPDVMDYESTFDPALWEKAQDAYKRNDLDMLQMIDDIVGNAENTKLESREESELIEMAARIEMAITRYQIKMEEMQKKFPFIEKEHLKNDSWVRARQAEIKKSIEEYQRTIIFLEAALNNLLNQEG